jgi:ubiquinone/menaquinone biosynthesis C-methylase UbiE
MDRLVWLAERRAAVIAAYDAEAPAYDEHEYPSDVQREWVARALRLIPPGGTVLDAPCGTGKYFPLVAAAGHRVVGVDQSAGMLAQARARGIAFALEHKALQDLSYDRAFDAVITVDAMENIPPEDWPLVLANLHRAVRPDGVMYLTVEEVDQSRIDQAFEGLSARGLPARYPAKSSRGERSPVTTTTRAGNKQSTGSSARAWRSSTKASGGKTGGAIALSAARLPVKAPVSASPTRVNGSASSSAAMTYVGIIERTAGGPRDLALQPQRDLVVLVSPCTAHNLPVDRDFPLVGPAFPGLREKPRAGYHVQFGRIDPGQRAPYR